MTSRRSDVGYDLGLSERQDPTTFADQDLLTQMGWFAHQIEARVGEKSPSPDVLTLMATFGRAIGKHKPESCIDKAYEIWQAADKRIRKEVSKMNSRK